MVSARQVVPAALFLCLLLTRSSMGQSKFPCTSGQCITIVPNQTSPGWIVGEIRAFAFGGDSPLLLDQMAAQGWVECRGQSVIRKDFDALWKVIGTNWGSADKSNVFYLPDFRGAFLRGWNHGKVPPPAYNKAPYVGDPDATTRVEPRPEAGQAGGDSGKQGDNVGSVQPDGAGPHQHPYTYTQQGTGLRSAFDGGQPPFTMAQQQTASSSTGNPSGKETRPSNAYIMYFVYVGKAAQDIKPSPAEAQQGLTGQVRPRVSH